MKINLLADAIRYITTPIEEGTMNYAYNSDQPPHPIMYEEEEKVKVISSKDMEWDMLTQAYIDHNRHVDPLYMPVVPGMETL